MWKLCVVGDADTEKFEIGSGSKQAVDKVQKVLVRAEICYVCRKLPCFDCFSLPRALSVFSLPGTIGVYSHFKYRVL